MPPDPDSKTDAPERDPLWIVSHAKDWYWHQLTGMCGGCGNANCHDGQCPTSRDGYCLTCPTRRETGEVRV